MRASFLTVSLAVAAPALAAAQAPVDTFRLGAVVVTATRLATPAALAPAAVTVLSGVDLRAQGIRSVADALRTVPGVSIAQSAGPGALTSVFMRGGESDYVQVLVDGVQVNDAGGAFDWAHLRTEDVERIEIVRGPASVLYGSDAVAGVVQIFTRAGGTPRIDAGISMDRGSRPHAGSAFYTRAYDVSAAGTAAAPFLAGGTLRYGISAAHTDADGLYEYNSAYDNTGLSARVQLAAPRFDLAVTGRRGDNEYHYPTSGSGVVFDRNQFALGDTRTFGIDGGMQLTGALELRLLATQHVRDGETHNPPDEPGGDTFRSDSWQRRRAVDARLNAHLPLSTVLTIGAEHERQRGTTAFRSDGVFGPFADSTADARRNTGWYAQLHGTPVQDVAVTLGTRVDDNSAFGRFTTARAALSWQAVPALRLRAAAGTAFKEPTFFENFATGFARGNPALQPEESRSWEAGIEHLVHDRVAISGTWFDQRFRNLIQYTFNTPTPDAPNYSNVGAARARGLELSARGEHRAASAHASYTFTSTDVTDEGFGADASFQEGQPLLRRPQHQGTLGVDVALGDAWRSHVTARFVGEREDLDFTDPANFAGTRVTLAAYSTVDAGITYSGLRTWNTRTALSLRVRNAFAKRYQEIYNFPTEGRVMQLSVRVGR